MQITTSSREETLILGENFARSLRPGDIVLLFGDLGSGKTTLTQGIAYGLGLAKDNYIRSPSFTLINEYTGKIPIYHIDLYRLDTFQEIESLGLEEVLFGQGVSVVEWAEKLFPKQNRKNTPGFGIEERFEIGLEIIDEEGRKFDIQTLIQPDREFPLFPLQ